LASILQISAVEQFPGDSAVTIRMCRNCGKNNPAESRFCSECGYSLTGSGSEVSIPPIQQAAPTQIEKQAVNVSKVEMPLPTTSNHDKAKSKTIRGKVRGFQRDTVSFGSGAPTKIVWSFVLDQYDGAGNIVSVFPVHMEGIEFRGSIGDGDEVEISSYRRKKDVLEVDHLYNLSRRAEVKATGRKILSLMRPRLGCYAISFVFLAIFLVFFLTAFSGIASVFRPILGFVENIFEIFDSFEIPTPEVVEPDMPGFAEPDMPGFVEHDTTLSNCQLIVTDSYFVNLLKEPRMNSPVLAQNIPDGTRLDATLRRDNPFTFYQVNSSYGTGWIAGNNMGITVSSGC
jgi:hypothetical protein